MVLRNTREGRHVLPFIVGLTLSLLPHPGKTAAVAIHEIQGSGTASPLVSEIVTISGVVVGDFPGEGGLGGFFVQEEEADADADPLTSEGIFVYAGKFGVDVDVGDTVSVTGKVTEYYGMTQIAAVDKISVLAKQGRLPTPSAVTLPLQSGDALESLEGMLVFFPQSLVVNDNYALGRYGTLQLSSRRWYSFTQLHPPDRAGYAAHRAARELDGIILDDGSHKTYPEPASYPGFTLSADTTLRLGDRITGLTGVMAYAFDAFRVHATTALPIDHVNARPLRPPFTAGTLRVASLNVQNYFTTFDDGTAICGPHPRHRCRGADSQREFDRQRAKLFAALLEMGAAVIGLQEVENHPSDEALIDLVNGLNAKAGDRVYDRIATGPLGGDVIKVALLYQPEVVVPLGQARILDSSADPYFMDGYNRPTIAQTFRHRRSQEIFTVAVNHFKSKGGSCPKDPDRSDGQGKCARARLAAATAVVDWLEHDFSVGKDDRDILVLGDLNCYAQEDPIRVFRQAGYTDLLEAHLGSTSHTYAFFGESGRLDHALASPSLLPFIDSAAIWHINSDEPRILDYDTEKKSAAQMQRYYDEDPFRSSDHDPVMVEIDFDR